MGGAAMKDATKLPFPVDLDVESKTEPVLSIGPTQPKSGGHVHAVMRGYWTNLYFFELNSDDHLIANNAVFEEVAPGTWKWRQPRPEAQSTLIFQASGGRGFMFYTAGPHAFDGEPGHHKGWVHHVAILGRLDGKFYIGPHDTPNKPWLDPGPGLAMDHVEGAALSEHRRTVRGVNTLARLGPFDIAAGESLLIPAAKIPRRGFVELVGLDVNLSARLWYHLGHAQGTMSAGLHGSMVFARLSASVPTRAGAVNVAALDTGLELRNLAAGPVRYTASFDGH
jgi:hypothetical protein